MAESRGVEPHPILVRTQFSRLVAVPSPLHYSPLIGPSGRIRTCDPLLPKQMRYQTALHSVKLWYPIVVTIHSPIAYQAIALPLS